MGMLNMVPAEIKRALEDSRYRKYNTWVYWSDFVVAAGTLLAGPYPLYGAPASGAGASDFKTNIQSPGVFAPGDEKFVMQSVNFLVSSPGTAAINGTAATVANLADTQRLIKNAFSLQVSTTGSVQVMDLPTDAIPAGPEPTGFISTGGVVAGGGFGNQDAFPFYQLFDSTTTAAINLVNRLTAMPTTTIIARVQVRFNGVRMVLQNRMGQGK